jgi:hypothetical protein
MASYIDNCRLSLQSFEPLHYALITNGLWSGTWVMARSSVGYPTNFGLDNRGAKPAATEENDVRMPL